MTTPAEREAAAFRRATDPLVRRPACELDELARELGIHPVSVNRWRRVDRRSESARSPSISDWRPRVARLVRWRARALIRLADRLEADEAARLARADGARGDHG